jgi:NADP-dependent 3-hydroxy acid dehydrogenase YdfG
MSQPIAFITGASSGIGQALALRYLQAGWRVALVARRVDALQAWAQQAGVAADRVLALAADVRDEAAITAAGQQCLAQWGLPEVVIANAGISVGMDTADPADLAVMRRTLETNVLGMAATFSPFVAPMCQRGRGALVGVASVAGIRGLPGHGAYCASKAATISYLESLRGECRASGVKVVTLVPGYVDTPLTQRNRYSMPFLMTPEAFAGRAFQAVQAGDRYRVIPWQMGVVATLMRALPNALFDRIFAGRPRKRRQHE